MKHMAEGDMTNNDAADAAMAGGGGRVDDGGATQPASGAEAAGGDPTGFESSGVGDPQQHGEGGGEGKRPGDWNPGERSGGGELY
jgi:hypothetical protein